MIDSNVFTISAAAKSSVNVAAICAEMSVPSSRRVATDNPAPAPARNPSVSRCAAARHNVGRLARNAAANVNATATSITLGFIRTSSARGSPPG